LFARLQVTGAVCGSDDTVFVRHNGESCPADFLFTLSAGLNRIVTKNSLFLFIDYLLVFLGNISYLRVLILK